MGAAAHCSVYTQQRIQHSAATPLPRSAQLTAITFPVSASRRLDCCAHHTAPRHFTPRGLRLVQRLPFQALSRAQPCTRVARQRPHANPPCVVFSPQRSRSVRCNLRATTSSNHTVRQQATEPDALTSAQRSPPSRLPARLDPRTPSQCSAGLGCPRLPRLHGTASAQPSSFRETRHHLTAAAADCRRCRA